jgi:hypothetical protein
LQGGWSAILDRTRAYARLAREDVLVHASWHILALYKLGQYSAAAEEVAKLGDMESLCLGLYLQNSYHIHSKTHKSIQESSIHVINVSVYRLCTTLSNFGGQHWICAAVPTFSIAILNQRLRRLPWGTAGEDSVPFVLRWLHTHLPGRLGRLAEQRERLYKLLNFCNVQLRDGWPSPPGACPPIAAEPSSEPLSLGDHLQSPCLWGTVDKPLP